PSSLGTVVRPTAPRIHSWRPRAAWKRAASLERRPQGWRRPDATVAAHRTFGTRRARRFHPFEPGLCHPQQRLGERFAAAGDDAAVRHHHEERVLVARVLLPHVLAEVGLRLALEEVRE